MAGTIGQTSVESGGVYNPFPQGHLIVGYCWGWPLWRAKLQTSRILTVAIASQIPNASFTIIVIWEVWLWLSLIVGTCRHVSTRIAVEASFSSCSPCHRPGTWVVATGRIVLRCRRETRLEWELEAYWTTLKNPRSNVVDRSTFEIT